MVLKVPRALPDAALERLRAEIISGYENFDHAAHGPAGRAILEIEARMASTFADMSVGALRELIRIGAVGEGGAADVGPLAKALIMASVSALRNIVSSFDTEEEHNHFTKWVCARFVEAMTTPDEDMVQETHEVSALVD